MPWQRVFWALQRAGMAKPLAKCLGIQTAALVDSRLGEAWDPVRYDTYAMPIYRALRSAEQGLRPRVTRIADFLEITRGVLEPEDQALVEEHAAHCARLDS